MWERLGMNKIKSKYPLQPMTTHSKLIRSLIKGKILSTGPLQGDRASLRLLLWNPPPNQLSRFNSILTNLTRLPGWWILRPYINDFKQNILMYALSPSKGLIKIFKIVTDIF